MSTKKTGNSFATFLLPFLLVCLFAVCSLFVASFGLKIYSGIQKDTDLSYQNRTCASYLTTKIRQSSGAGHVAVAEQVLILTETLDGQTYDTRIYLKDGQLVESFGKQGDEVNRNVDAIAELGYFQPMLTNPNLIEITYADLNGQSNTIRVYLQQTEGRGV